MRFLVSLVLAVGLAASTPAAETPRWEKFLLKHSECNRVAKLLVAAGTMRAGLVGLLAFPADNSLLARGDSGALKNLQEIVRLLDRPWSSLPSGEYRVEIPLPGAEVDAALARLRASNLAVQALRDGERLILVGHEDRLIAALAGVASSGPRKPAGGDEDFGWTEITLPEGTELTYSGLATTDRDGVSVVVTGIVRIQAKAVGFDLRTVTQAVRITREPGKPIRIRLLGEQRQPAQKAPSGMAAPRCPSIPSILSIPSI